MFFVFTAKGVESCYDPIHYPSDCTIGRTPATGYCAYHSSYTSGGEIIYANMPYAATWHSGFLYTCDNISQSPNGNLDADIEISPTSHEMFEAVTDSDPWGPGD